MNCPHCDKKLSNNFSLSRHIKKFHGQHSDKDNIDEESKSEDNKTDDETERFSNDEDSDSNSIDSSNGEIEPQSKDKDDVNSLNSFQKDLNKCDYGEKRIKPKNVKAEVFKMWFKLITYGDIPNKLGKIKQIDDLWNDHKTLIRFGELMADAVFDIQNLIWTLSEYSELYNDILSEIDRLKTLQYNCKEIRYAAWRNRIYGLREMLKHFNDHDETLEEAFKTKGKWISISDNDDSMNEEEEEVYTTGDEESVAESDTFVENGVYKRLM
jgi:hypothetical protein